MRATEFVKRNALPFVAGIATGLFLLAGAQQDQIGVASGLAPVAAFCALFIPTGGGGFGGYVWLALPAILNGLAYVATAAVIRSCWMRRRWLSFLVIGLLVFWLGLVVVGSRSDRQLRPYSEVVLQPGMRITAVTPNGPLTITAGEGTRRTFQGENWHKSLLLVARTSRWYGSLGLYDPAESYSPYGRLLAEEGRQHFSTESDAEAWLRGRSFEAGVGKEKLIFTNDGLVLRYSMCLVPGTGVPTAQVDLWQIYVDGHRPHSLPGADDGAIRVEGGTVAEFSTPH